MEWTVVTVVVALVGLFLTVGTPVLKLNSNIVRLNASIDALREKTERNEAELKDQKLHASESHRRIWEHNEEQDKQISDHENRITLLEKK